MTDHLNDLITRHPALAVCADDIRAAADLLGDVFAHEGMMLVCGNGGSAADADHWSGELLKCFESRRPLSLSEREGLSPVLAEHLSGGFRAIPLHAFTAFASAFANDCAAPEAAYAQLVWTLGKPGDVLVGLSTSGNSRNVLLALEAARARGMRTVGLSGQDGGALATAADVCIRVPEKRTCHVQEWHVVIYHTISLMLEDRFFGVSSDLQ